MRSFFPVRTTLAALGLLATAASAQAFAIFGRSWASGDIPMHLQLGPAPAALSDGAPGWGAVAEAALNDWNAQIARSRFTVVRDSAAARAEGNRINNVFFDSTIYGDAFGSGVLAVTLTFRNSRNTTEADVIFNANRAWDSYRGPLRRNTMDFRRVALHEFGHALGLDHPDEASPAQAVSAVMNSIVSSVETLRPDDIAGAKALYDTSAPNASPPTIVAQPAGRSVQVTGSYTLNVTATGTGPLAYSWRFRAPGASASEPLLLADGPSYTIGSVQPADAGVYTVAVSNTSGTVTSNSAVLEVTPIATTPNTTLANISTRGTAGTNANVLTAGLVIGGTTAKNVVVRAVGPALANFGVTGRLGDPELRILDRDGRVVAHNDNWQAGPAVEQLAAAFARVGAFEFPSGSRDAALLVSLPPGNYTAQVGGVGGTEGVALVEVYDADPDAAAARSRRLLNIATRGRVGQGEDVLIAGLVVTGPGPRTYLIRGVGPTLASFGVPGALDDPFLEIYRGETLLRENDDWDSPSHAQPALSEAAGRIGAFPLQVRRDSAMLVTLQPGSYTAKLSGFEGSTGVGLIEIYEVP